MRLAVTCGYPTSLHAIALIHQLSAAGHDVSLCLSVRLLDAARIRFYLRQIGWRGLMAKVRSRFSTDHSPLPTTHSSLTADPSPETLAMREYFQQHRLHSRTVRQACRQTSARLLTVPSLNHRRAVAALKAASVDLIVYAGGGLLRKEFLATPRLGVLNAHGGPLEGFRGMNAAEWALLHGVRPAVTVHYVDTGIDTGPIFFQRPIPPEVWANGLAYGRGAGTRLAVESLLEAVQAIAAGNTQPVAQDPQAGRQFFVMADPLLEVLRHWIRARRTPVRDPKDFHFATCDR